MSGQPSSMKSDSAPLSCLAMALLLGCLNAAIAQANDTEFLTEEDLFSDIPLVSSASRFPQALNNAPASVIIIDRAMIQASGALEIPDLFRLLPGFQVYSPAYSHSTFNYHTLPDGFPSRLEIKIDGRSAYEPFTNTVFWITQGLELEDIDYIEVVRGSNVPAYGSNAINGSINIVTRSPLETSGYTLRTELGSNDTRNISASFSDTQGDLSYRLAGRYRSNTGFPDYAGEPVEDDSEAMSATVNLIWAPSLQDNISVQLGYSDSDFSFDEGNAGAEQHELFPWAFDLAYQHVDWQHQFNDKHSFQLMLSHSRMELNAVADRLLLSELIGFPPEWVFPGIEDFEVVLGIEDGLSERYELDISHTAKPNQKLTYNWGLSAKKDRAKSQLHLSRDTAVSENYYRLFANAGYRPSSWLTLNAAASLGYSDTVGDFPSFRLASNFHLNANNTLRLAASRATRAPTVLNANSLRSIHFNGIIYEVEHLADPDIDNEQRDGLELGYYGFFNDGKLTLDLKLFYDDNVGLMDIQIDSDYQGPNSLDNEVVFFTNSFDSEDKGFEAFLKWQPTQQWLISAQYTRLSTTANHFRRINPVVVTNNRDSAVPEHLASLLVNHDFGGGLQAAISYYYQSDVAWHRAPYTPSYDRLDFNIRKQLKVGGMQGRVELIAQNIFGDNYSEYRTFQQFKPRYYVRFVTEF
ncbi:MAG: iron complex outermembrane receptor protein [Halieaceae bacterium]|jgi:iron complex outermembrane receptor protein